MYRVDLFRRLRSFIVRGFIPGLQIVFLIGVAGSTFAEEEYFFASSREPPLRDIDAREVILASEYGARPDDGKDDSDALRKAFEAAASGTINRTILIEPGIYHLSAEKDNASCFTLSNIENLKILAEGVFIVVQTPSAGLLRLESCRNIVIQGFTVDFDPLPFTQGTVTDVQASKGFVTVAISPGYPGLNDRQFQESRRWGEGTASVTKGLLKDNHIAGRLKAEAPNMIGVKSWVPIGDRLFCLNVGLYYVKYFQAGDSYVQLARGGPSVFEVSESEQVTFKNITIHTGPGTSYKSGHSRAVNLLGCRTVLKEDRWQTTCADGMIAYGNRSGPWFEDCVFEATGDDTINVNTPAGVFDSFGDDNSVVLKGRPDHRGVSQHMNFQAGDTIRIYDPERGELAGKARVVSAEAKGNLWNVVLDAIPPEVRAHPDFRTLIVYNDETCGPGTVIRNNIFRNTRRYGVVCQGRDVLIESNVFDGVSGDAIVVMNTIHSGSGFAARNVMIRGNTFRDCYHQALTSRGREHAGIIGLALERQGYKPAAWQGIENVVIERNTFLGWGAVPAIKAGNTRQLMIRDNIFNAGEKTVSQHHDVISTVLFTNVSKVTLENNCINDLRLGRDVTAAFAGSTGKLFMMNGNTVNGVAVPRHP